MSFTTSLQSTDEHENGCTSGEGLHICSKMTGVISVVRHHCEKLLSCYLEQGVEWINLCGDAPRPPYITAKENLTQYIFSPPHGVSCNDNTRGMVGLPTLRGIEICPWGSHRCPGGRVTLYNQISCVYESQPYHTYIHTLEPALTILRFGMEYRIHASSPQT